MSTSTAIYFAFQNYLQSATKKLFTFKTFLWWLNRQGTEKIVYVSIWVNMFAAPFKINTRDTVWFFANWEN